MKLLLKLLFCLPKTAYNLEFVAFLAISKICSHEIDWVVESGKHLFLPYFGT